MEIYLWQVVCVVFAVLITSTGSLAQLDVCGQLPLKTKIVGGASAAPGSWPWQVSFQIGNRHFCGGSLINENWVLSAAHCFQRIHASSVKVLLGLESLQGTNPNKQERYVTRIINHEGYSSASNNDIALVQLSFSVTFNNYISPVCLAESNSFFYDDTEVWITGFGRIGSDGFIMQKLPCKSKSWIFTVELPYPKTLQEVKVPIVSSNDCIKSYGSNVITDNMMCAGLTQGGKDSCQGDSGGPLVVKQNTAWVQAGIVSFGYGCAKPSYPGVYTRVSNYQDWINYQISSSTVGYMTSNSNHGSHKPFCLFLFFYIIPLLVFLYIF